MNSQKIPVFISLVLVLSCKPRKPDASDLYKDDPGPRASEIESFRYEPDTGVYREMIARVGCDEAKKWVLSPREPLLKIIPRIKEQKSPYDFLLANLLSQDDRPCPQVSKKSSIDGIKRLHQAVTSKGYSLTVIMIGGFGSHFTIDGALALSRASWAAALPKESFRVERVECTPNSYASDDVCVPIFRTKIETLISQESGKPHVYLMWGYSKGGTVSLQLLADWPQFRERVIGLITVGSPFGGGLPMKSIVPVFEQTLDRGGQLSPRDQQIFNGLLLYGAGYSGPRDDLKTAAGVAALLAPDQRPMTRAGLVSILPRERLRILRDVTPRWDLSRLKPHPLTGKKVTPIFHVSAAVDLAEFRVVPEMKISKDSKVQISVASTNVMHIAELALVHELASHPLSDTCIALEHSVIPPASMPKGATAELLSLLKLDHFSLGLSEQPGAHSPPGEAITDSIIDVVGQKLGGAN